MEGVARSTLTEGVTLKNILPTSSGVGVGLAINCEGVFSSVTIAELAMFILGTTDVLSMEGVGVTMVTYTL